MPRFNITTTFSLLTEVEPEGISFGSIENETEGFEDSSSFGSESVTAYGGEIAFVVEADNEDDAYSEAERMFADGYEVTDYNGLTWQTDGVDHSVEAVEEPLTLASAVEIVRAAITSSDLDDETQEALRFLLNAISQR